MRLSASAAMVIKAAGGSALITAWARPCRASACSAARRAATARPRDCAPTVLAMAATTSRSASAQRSVGLATRNDMSGGTKKKSKTATLSMAETSAGPHPKLSAATITGRTKTSDRLGAGTMCSTMNATSVATPTSARLTTYPGPGEVRTGRSPCEAASSASEEEVGTTKSLAMGASRLLNESVPSYATWT